MLSSSRHGSVVLPFRMPGSGRGKLPRCSLASVALSPPRAERASASLAEAEGVGGKGRRYDPKHLLTPGDRLATGHRLLAAG